jgi:hypothetical protein
MRRALTSFVTAVGVAGLLSASALALAAPSASAAVCPNEAFRTGYSAALPDCRAYELVSPPSIQPFFETFGNIQNIKFAAAVIGAEKSTFAAQSSTDSGLVFFSTFAPSGSTTDGPFFLASRGSSGWSTQNLIPPQQTEVTDVCLPYMIGWSTNLERGVLADGFTSSATTCGADEPELVPGEPRGAQNLFVRDSSTGSFQLIDQKPLSGLPATAIYQGGSRDLGVIAFTEEAELTPGAPAGADSYVWGGGSVDRLLTVLPNGQPTEGEIVDAAALSALTPTSATFSHAIAPDGSRIEFTAKGDLYTRINPAAEAEGCGEPGKACTVQIDASETADPGGGGVFEGSSGEGGEVVYFTDENRLTSNSTAAAGEADLYAYDFRRPAGERLTDLSVDLNVGEHAHVLGYVGNNETGTPGDYAYFVATGALTSNENSEGATATSGAPNLYLAHGGVTRFVATLGLIGDSCDWENPCMSARVSANGRYLGFNSLEQLTKFANLDAQTSEPDQEIFLYDAEVDQLSCASCGKIATAPTAPASIRLPEDAYVKVPIPLYLQRNVSDTGQVFFDTQNRLLESARNGVSNVYEYEEGQLRLLSSGTAEASSYFYEASSDGGDVYLITAQALALGSSSAELAIFDAKVNGGFPASPSTTSEPCSGESCSGPQSIAPHLPAISSASTSGSGNLEPAVSKPAATRSLTGAQKLAKALKACRAKRSKHKRSVCESQARKRYGPHLKKSANTNRRGK